MIYLQRLVERLSSHIPSRMLLPDSKGWNGVIDPFENTQYLLPVYPPSSRKRSPEKTERGQPFSAPPHQPVQIAPEKRKSGIVQPAVEVPSGEYLEMGKSAPLKKVPDMHPPLAAAPRTTADESTPDMHSVRQSDNQTKAYPQESDASLRPQHIPSETDWLRRYLSDASTVFDGGKPRSSDTNMLHRQTHWPLLHKHAPLTDGNSAAPFITPVPKTVARRTVRREQKEESELVIGQLTVDVIPVKPVTAPQRRAKTVKKRADDKRGKLTQTETARFGFGIGQM